MDRVSGLAWSWWGQKEQKEGPGNLLEKKTVGMAKSLDVEKGGKEDNHAGLLGLGMVVPVTEPSRGPCTWATPTKCWLDGGIHEQLEERRRACDWATWMVNTVESAIVHSALALKLLCSDRPPM